MKKLPTSPPPSVFPSDVLKWMKKNAAPRMALKSMQICKYFQHHEFPYFVVRVLVFRNGVSCVPICENRHRDTNLKALTKKLWITESLYIEKDVLRSLLPKIAVIEIKSLVLKDLHITYAEFKILTAAESITNLEVDYSYIKDKNGADIPLEDILEALLNICYLIIIRDINSFVSSHKATKNVPSSLKRINLVNISDYFDSQKCFEFIEENQRIYFDFDCDYEWSTEDIPTIQRLTDNLIEMWSPENKPPSIDFLEQTQESREKLKKLRNFYDERNNIA